MSITSLEEIVASKLVNNLPAALAALALAIRGLIIPVIHLVSPE
ncbi:TPA: hypothetical protein ACF35D_002230 [Escherichia coli]